MQQLLGAETSTFIGRLFQRGTAGSEDLPASSEFHLAGCPTMSERSNEQEQLPAWLGASMLRIVGLDITRSPKPGGEATRNKTLTSFGIRERALLSLN